ncbi:N-acetylmuramoyl-L-alanine amidase family protein [Rufibacter roseus]|uniref:N-acetylmuramoyl-L-alanine amidase n=1 Tax=Rufibacter roseus TaxID=1567108 RepID=A0ABW2DLL8_9BACT|nr:N-acetylmuramoyl-L-alanine amidase [Rufibacter roseus]
MKINLYLWFVLFLSLAACTSAPKQEKGTLAGRVICLDAGHGGTAQIDSYRVGPTGEREEWINLRVALLLQKMLEEKGAKVLMTRTADINVPFDDRVKLAKENKAEVFLSIHHNATADSTVNFPIIYFHGSASENVGSVVLAKHVGQALVQNFYPKATPVSVVSDHTIFPTAGAKVLRDTYGIPGVIAEASFFTNPTEEERLKQESHNRKEALAYVAALEAFFSKPVPAIQPKKSIVELPPFRAAQEAERMNETARRWRQDFEEGEKLLKNETDTTALRQAYELFTRSVRSFPDSYLARQSHQYRAAILQKLGKKEEAQQEATRAKEYYVRLQEE